MIFIDQEHFKIYYKYNIMNLFNSILDNTNKSLNIKLPWVEKYRPKKFEEILLDPFIKTKIVNIFENKSIPNMIITGEPSTGKTSTILYIAKEIYKDNYQNFVLELNASDDRGLSIISNKVYPFCKKNTSENSNTKLIILDEADSITIKAQNLLSNIISEFRTTTRFVFICNDSTQIIESIQSKCIIIKYPKISFNHFYEKIKYICIEENILYDDEGIKALIFVSDYDIRQTINNLECLCYSYGNLTEDNVYLLIDKPTPYYIYMILDNCYKKNFNGSLQIIKELYDKGYSPSDILLSFMKYLFEKNINEYAYYDVNEEDRLLICNIISEHYIKINSGLDTLLQLSGCIAKIYIEIQKIQKMK